MGKREAYIRCHAMPCFCPLPYMLISSSNIYWYLDYLQLWAMHIHATLLGNTSLIESIVCFTELAGMVALSPKGIIRCALGIAMYVWWVNIKFAGTYQTYTTHRHWSCIHKLELQVRKNTAEKHRECRHALALYCLHWKIGKRRLTSGTKNV